MKIHDVLGAATFREDKMSKVNLFETKNFFCDVYCLRPGQEQKVHSHAEEDKLYYAIHGEGKVTVGEETRPLREGEIVMAAAGESHGIANDSREDLICVVFMAPHPSL